MKKVILGTTALVAASALTAGSASAAEKIKLGVSGYLQSSFVVVDHDDDSSDPLPTDIRHEGEVFFTGSTTLDNGLKFGVNIQLEARATGDQVDETYMYVDGSFGRILFGSEDSAPYLMHYASPSPVPAWGLASPNAKVVGTGNNNPSTYANEIGDTDKISYFTPRFSGFQLGVSYTPDADEETGTGANPYQVVSTEGAANEAFSVGANYSGKFGDVSFKASLGYQHIDRDDVTTTTITRTNTFAGGGTIVEEFTRSSTTGLETLISKAVTGTLTGAQVITEAASTETSSAEDTDEFNAGVGVGVGGFNIGAAYKYTDNDGGTDDRERHDWNVGVTYGQGPWKIGVQYAGIDLEDAGEGEQHAFVVGGQYTLGPGITAFGGVQYWDMEDSLENRGDNATVVFLGTALSF